MNLIFKIRVSDFLSEIQHKSMHPQGAFFLPKGMVNGTIN